MMGKFLIPNRYSVTLKPVVRTQRTELMSADIHFTITEDSMLFTINTNNFHADTFELYKYSDRGLDTIIYHAPVPEKRYMTGRIYIDAISTSPDEFSADLAALRIGARLIHHGNEIIELAGEIHPEPGPPFSIFRCKKLQCKQNDSIT